MNLHKMQTMYSVFLHPSHVCIHVFIYSLIYLFIRSGNHLRRKHSLNLVGEICYDITKKCPSYVNATSTRQERPVHKGHLLTERKVEEKHQGFLRHIVAESWKEEVGSSV
jgi:hypothetical protein